MAGGLEAHQRAVAAEKRAALVEAARRLFGERGYERVSVGAVAKAAGVSLATLYKHFESKEALFGAILAERCDAFVRRLAATDVPAEGLEAQLCAFAEAYTRGLADPSTAETLRLLIGDAPAFPHLAEAFFTRLEGPVQGPLRDHLRLQREAGLIDYDDEQRAVRELLGMLEGGVLWRMLLRGEGVDDAHVREVVHSAVETWLARYAV